MEIPALSVEGSGLLAKAQRPIQNLPQEVILDYQTANQVTWQTLKEYPVFGSGPGTFLFNFTKFKPDEFNQTRFWNIRFDRGPSHLVEVIGTTGALGLLSYSVVLVMFLLLAFLSLSKLKNNNKILFLPLLLAWLALHGLAVLELLLALLPSFLLPLLPG